VTVNGSDPLESDLTHSLLVVGLHMMCRVFFCFAILSRFMLYAFGYPWLAAIAAGWGLWEGVSNTKAVRSLERSVDELHTDSPTDPAKQ
jgi:hypothetical protein